MSIFYDPYGEKDVHQRKLPHWSQSGRLYFVTFRLADSLPADKLTQICAEREAWLETNKEPYSPAQWLEYHRLFSERISAWLDEGAGSCVLARPDVAAVVAEAFAHFDGIRYRLDHWVIMPNHVHVLVLPMEGHAIRDIVHGWKSYSANRINRLCGRNGALWQAERFDHIVRSQKQLEKLREYIISNAEAAHGRARLSTACITEMDTPK